MNDSRLRAPYAILCELLGEPDPEHGMDKVSTCFAFVFEGQDVFVHDFHKEEWGEDPACLTDLRHVWSVFGDQDVDRFCRWLSREVKLRMASAAGGTTLDAAGRARLNQLLAGGRSLDEALKQVKRLPAAQLADYDWPVTDDPDRP
jgi:hypothetical protein